MSKEIEDLKKQIMWLQNQNALLVNRQEALRDHFAGLSMQTLPKDMGDMKTLARMSYNMADAMLAEREKKDDSI